MIGDDLNPEQLAFLRFHCETPAPHEWAWKLRPHGLRETPGTPGARLFTSRYTEGRWQQQVSISAENFAGLDAYWSAAFVPNAAARRLVDPIIFVGETETEAAAAGERASLPHEYHAGSASVAAETAAPEALEN